MKTAYQIKVLLKAKRSVKLMKEGYGFRNIEGDIIEVNSFGKPLSSIELALLEGATDEELMVLLNEREKNAMEWKEQQKLMKEKENEKTEKESVD